MGRVGEAPGCVGIGSKQVTEFVVDCRLGDVHPREQGEAEGYGEEEDEGAG
jgi:hypothetical protein